MIVRPDRGGFDRLWERLCEVYRSAYRALPEYAYRDPDRVREYLRWLYEVEPEGFMVWEDNGQPLGFVSIHAGWHLLRGRPVAELQELAVAEPWQGRGIGSELLAEALRWARGRGQRGVELWVGRHNLRAQRLYQRAGFRPRGSWGKWLRMSLAIARSDEPAPR